MRTKHFLQEEEKGGEGKAAEGGESTPEDRAARIGWTSKEKFRGDPTKWVDAETFLKNGEESLPILRENNRKLQKALEEQAKTAAEFAKYHEQTEKRAYERAKKELQAEIKAAAKAGDEAGAAAAAEELAQVEADHKVAAAKPPSDPVFDSWLAQNSWYNDPDMAIEAEAIAYKLRKKGTKDDGLAFLDKVKDEMKKQFPEKFGNPRRSQAGAVEGSGGGGDGGGKSKGWSDLPAEAKAAGERFIKQGYIKDKEAYAKQFFSQNELAA